MGKGCAAEEEGGKGWTGESEREGGATERERWLHTYPLLAPPAAQTASLHAHALHSAKMIHGEKKYDEIEGFSR